MDDLVSVEWLAAQRDAPDLRLLDATYLPFEPERDAATEYRAGHLPGARFLDLATLADPDGGLPSTVPPLRVFVQRMAALGVSRDDRIVLYDDSPHHTSARAWWLLRLFGAADVAILDGGIAAWRAAGLAIETGEGGGRAIAPEATRFVARDDAMLTGFAAMQAAVADGRQIVDARGGPRFSGAEADPRPGVAPGHMPGALNLPYARMFEPDGRWKSSGDLSAAFDAAGVDPAASTIFTCGSGITAAGLFFAAHRLGRRGLSLYDGSWSEWGADPSTPKETV